ncbi:MULTISPECIES: hypothetical protein [unclassified Crossiella]|nr:MULTISPECIES: hypothetical protein [unclassified Crossiella]
MTAPDVLYDDDHHPAEVEVSDFAPGEDDNPESLMGEEVTG